MKARGQSTCSSCARLRGAEALDSTAPRDLDVVAVSMSPVVSRSYPVLDGAQDSFKLHPEAPSLERRAALQALAWQLTQLANAVGVTAEEALHDSALDTDPHLSRWQVFVQEARTEFYDALRREVSHTEHGFTEVLVSLAFVLPTAILWRRRYAVDQAYGPIGALRWPYRYPGGLLRELALEGAVWLCVVGGALLVGTWVHLSPTAALW